MMSFLEMSGYAVYVWSAYGITLLVLILNILTVFLDDSKTTAP